MTRSKDRHSYDRKLTRKLTLSNGTLFPDAEQWQTPPRDWEGYMDRKSKAHKQPILWETSAMNIPELENVIKATGLEA